MTGKTIPDLPAAAPLSGTEPIETVQGGESVRMTAQDVADLASTGMNMDPQSGTAYTFQLSDNGNYVPFTSSSSVAATVPPHSSVAFPIGATINIEQAGTGVVTVGGGAGVTINSAGGHVSTNGIHAVATLVQRETLDVWTLFGNLT